MPQKHRPPDHRETEQQQKLQQEQPQPPKPLNDLQQAKLKRLFKGVPNPL